MTNNPTTSSSDYSFTLRQCQALMQQGQHAKCIALSGRLTDMVPDRVDGWLCRANALNSLGQFAEALAAYQHALVIEPEAPDLHHNVGVMLLRLGNIGKSLIALKHAAKLGLDHPALHRNLGHALLQDGDHISSEMHFRRAITLAPMHHSTHSGLLFSLIHHAGLQVRPCLQRISAMASNSSALSAAMADQATQCRPRSTVETGLFVGGPARAPGGAFSSAGVAAP